MPLGLIINFYHIFYFWAVILKKHRLFLPRVWGNKKPARGKKSRPIFCNGKHPYWSKNCQKLCLWAYLHFYRKYFQIYTNYSRKILGGLVTSYRLFITPNKFKRNKRLFFTPRLSNLWGKKKPPFFITKISIEF